MIILSTKTIAMLPMKSRFTIDGISKLCRDGKLYAFREDKPFAPWQIPADSFALYLHYNPVLKNEFLEMTSLKEDDKMNIVRRTIRDLLNKDSNYDEETYSIKQLTDIFGYPENQIKSMMSQVTDAPFGFPFLAKCRQRFSLHQVLTMLTNNSEQLEKLKDRHKMLLANADPRESAVRHLLMLYAYYESNGYLV